MIDYEEESTIKLAKSLGPLPAFLLFVEEGSAISRLVAQPLGDNLKIFDAGHTIPPFLSSREAKFWTAFKAPSGMTAGGKIAGIGQSANRSAGFMLRAAAIRTMTSRLGFCWPRSTIPM